MPFEKIITIKREIAFGYVFKDKFILKMNVGIDLKLFIKSAKDFLTGISCVKEKDKPIKDKSKVKEIKKRHWKRYLFFNNII